MRNLIITIVFSTLTSCVDNKVNEINIIAKVDSFQSADENEELGKDLISYNYSEKIKKQFPDVDLKCVTLQYFRQSSNNEVTIRLILTNTAIVFSKDLIDFLKPLIKQNMVDHTAHIQGIKKAITCSDNYSQLIQDENIDSLWALTSPDLKLTISKNDLVKAFNQKDSSFNSNKRFLTSKQYFNSLSLGQRQLKGDFYLLNYSYDKAFEQIVLQGDSMKLAGYTFLKNTK